MAFSLSGAFSKDYLNPGEDRKTYGVDRIMKTSLSILVPVYNEQHLVYESLKRLKILDTSDQLERVEVIVVDDCSKDASAKVLEKFREEQITGSSSKIQWRFLRHETNAGKGKAVKT